jgi:hypothetical protein
VYIGRFGFIACEHHFEELRCKNKTIKENFEVVDAYIVVENFAKYKRLILSLLGVS